MGKGREKLLIIVAALCVVALVGDKLVLTPLVGAWSSRSKRVAELRRDLAKAESLIEREDAIRARWQEMRRGGLPRDTATAESEILEAVGRWSRESNLAVLSLRPQWSREDDEEHVKLRCRAIGQGSMPAVARFLYELETDPLALRAEEVQISARGDSGWNLTVNVKFSGLILAEGTQR